MLKNSDLIKPHDVTSVALTNLYNKLFITNNTELLSNNAPLSMIKVLIIITLVYNSYILRIFKKEKLNFENL